MFSHPVYSKIKEFDFILCSSSPRRLDILRQIGFDPLVEKSQFKEDLDKAKYGSDLAKYVEDTAHLKLKEVYDRKKGEYGKGPSKGMVMLSADTVIICNNKVYEKPKSFENNVSMLKELRDQQDRGHRIEIVSSCILFKDNGDRPETRRFSCCTAIKLIDGLTDDLIREYCRSGEGLQVAGGFKIQGLGSILFDSVNGDFYNCVGLPASRVFSELVALLC